MEAGTAPDAALDAVAAGTPVTPAPITSCATDVLRLTLESDALRQESAVWFAVVWGEDTVEVDSNLPRVAYQQPLDPASDFIQVPLAELKLPFEQNLICTRACRDRYTCPCIETPEVALASLILVVDADRDGTLSPSEIKDGRIAVANAVVGWSFRRYMPTPPRPYFWAELFVDGIEAGSCPYRIEAQDVRDRLRTVSSATRFGLVACKGQPRCQSRTLRW